MDIESATLIAEAQEARCQAREAEKAADRHTAARKLGFAFNYVIRNATKGEGDVHGAVDQLAKALTNFIDTERKYI
jgi:hypothetical protein